MEEYTIFQERTKTNETENHYIRTDLGSIKLDEKQEKCERYKEGRRRVIYLSKVEVEDEGFLGFGNLNSNDLLLLILRLSIILGVLPLRLSSSSTISSHNHLHCSLSSFARAFSLCLFERELNFPS